MTLAIQTRALTKVYQGVLRKGGQIAVDGLSLEVPCGQVFGFLGPNGAGKTTTIMMLLGAIHPTAGDGALLGAPLGNVEVRRRIGFLPEKFQFHDFLQAEELLDLHGRLYGLSSHVRRKRIPELLELVGLADRKRSRVGQFSKGMQQRLGLATALISDPDLVILDEPTSALDPLGRREVRKVILQLKQRGKTVFLNSHLLSEIELTCDRVGILYRGRLVQQGGIEELLAPGATVEMRVAGMNEQIETRMRKIARDLSVDNESVHAVVESEKGISDLAEAVVAGGGRLLMMMPERESLEEMFVRIIEQEGARC